MTRWPTTIGDPCPRPGIAAFHRTFSVLLQRRGGAWSAEATPSLLAPRQDGQSDGAVWMPEVDCGERSAPEHAAAQISDPTKNGEKNNDNGKDEIMNPPQSIETWLTKKTYSAFRVLSIRQRLRPCEGPDISLPFHATDYLQLGNNCRMSLETRGNCVQWPSRRQKAEPPKGEEAFGHRRCRSLPSRIEGTDERQSDDRGDGSQEPMDEPRRSDAACNPVISDHPRDRVQVQRGAVREDGAGEGCGEGAGAIQSD